MFTVYAEVGLIDNHGGFDTLINHLMMMYLNAPYTFHREINLFMELT